MEKEAARQRQVDELGARGEASPSLTELADAARTALDALLDALDEHNAFALGISYVRLNNMVHGATAPISA